MNRILFLLVFLIAFLEQTNAQIQLVPYDSVPVIQNTSQLMNPWAGGMNCPQFSEIDLNGDGVKDLVAFERNFYGTVKTFINEEGYYVYQPEFRQLFPEMSNWMLLRDYNCDGRMDIFTSVPAGVAVYRNEPDPESGLRFVLESPILQSEGPNGQTPVYVSSVDVPAIDDIDNDGDPDILSFDILGNAVEYHRNMSVENYGNCQHLEFVQESRCWGYFSEDGNSNSVTLFDTCENKSSVSPHVARHAGSTILSIDLTGNGLKDLLLGDITYPNLVFLENGGTLQEAGIVDYSTAFPGGENPVDLTVFPAGYFLDVTGDGLRDLIVAPNNPNTSENFDNIWFYKNVGMSDLPEFSFQQKNFLQEGMIDAGERSYPVFFDEDADGLMDIVIGNFGYFVASGEYDSRLTLLRNTGTTTEPAFGVADDDYGDLGQYGFNGIYPAFGDMDGDGDTDMITGDEDGNVHYFRNDAGAGNQADFALSQPNFNGIDVGQSAKPQITDVNRDGLPDLLVGERSGTVNYFENAGTPDSPQFSSQPTIEELGSVDVMHECCTGYSAPLMTEDSLGNKILYVGSEKGWLYLYNNIEENLTGTFNLMDSLDLHAVNCNLSGADINGDGKPEFVSGSYAGGISLLKTGKPSSLGISSKERQKTFIRVMPNPALNFVNISSENFLSNELLTIRLVDIQGKTIRQMKTDFSNKNIQIEVSGLTPGIYLILVQSGIKQCSAKFIKKAQ